MKKIIIITAILLSPMAYVAENTGVDFNGKQTTYVFNKTANAIERVYMDGTKVVEKAYSIGQSLTPKIEKALLQLGTSLKVSASEVWDILVFQQVVYSLTILTIILLTIGSWLHFYYRLRIWHEKNEKDSYIQICVITCVMAIVGTITSGVYFHEMLTGFINPKFGALKTIAELAAQIR